MASSLQKIEGDDSVLLRVTHSNIKTFSTDIRLSQQMPVDSVKEKIWKKCGTSVNSMHLELYDDSNYKISDLTDNSRPLGFYSPLDGFRLHVIDLDPSSVTSGGWLEDTSLVEKYTISEEAYNKREGMLSPFPPLLNLRQARLRPCRSVDDAFSTEVFIGLTCIFIPINGTFRKFKERLSSQNPSTAAAKVPNASVEGLCSNIKVGSRCEVEPGEKRGVVKFVGQAEALGPGLWVGIQYDEPLGKHDGMVKGVRYFECPPSHGAMVRAEKVKVGDYPERDPFVDEI